LDQYYSKDWILRKEMISSKSKDKKVKKVKSKRKLNKEEKN
jgi:hypothetical protein